MTTKPFTPTMATKATKTSKTLADLGAEHKALGSMEQADAKSGVGKPSSPTTKRRGKTAKPSETTAKPTGADDTKTTETPGAPPAKRDMTRLEYDLATAGSDELQAERLQLNNRLSGLRTRYKRSEPGVVQKGIMERIEALAKRRSEIGAELKRREPAA